MRRLLVATTVSTTLRAFLLPFARYFRAKGWRVDGVARGALGCPECVEAFDQVFEARWSRNPLMPSNMTLATVQLRTLVERHQYDLIHVHTPVAAFVSRYALRYMPGKPRVLYTAHGFHFYRGGPPVRNVAVLGLEKLAGKWTDYLVVINEEDCAAARNHRLVPEDRLRYIPGIGLDTAAWSPERVDCEQVKVARRRMGLGDDDRLFLMVGEFTRNKRHADAVRALASMGRSGVHLAFAGEGPNMKNVERLARTLGLTDKVHFLAFRRDVPVLVRAAIATLLPSEREGLPRAAMESLSLQIPVIGTDIRGLRDLLGAGCGILVPRGDIDALAKAMAWLLDHPEEAARMGKKGREQMKAYDLEHILNSYEELYEEALSRTI